MFANVVSREAALLQSIEALREIVSLYDDLGLMFPAAHAATALDAAHAALDQEHACFSTGIASTTYNRA